MTGNAQENLWVILVHASTEAKIKQRQWEEFVEKRQFWGDKWIIGGDFNDIKAHEEKNGGMKRLESSFVDFRNFMTNINMGKSSLEGEVTLELIIERVRVSFKKN